MKKGYLVILISVLFFPVFSQGFLPEELNGIWEGKDRIIFFEEPQNDKNPEIFIVLKNFYGWYYDRAAEDSFYSDKGNRDRNAATPKNAEHISYTVTKNPDYNTYNFNINYSKHNNYTVHLACINENLFLNFYTRDIDFNNEEQLSAAKNTYDGFYRGNIVSKGLMISNQSVPENITCFYVIQDRIYNIRYWKTDMDYSSEYARFTYEQDSFEVPCHVQSGGYTFSCVSGRSKKVRNPQPSAVFNPGDYIFNEEHTLMICDKEIYLTKMADKNTFNQLVELVKEHNSHRHPPVQPLFPDEPLDFHWDMIDELEKNNQLIQAVRIRQRNFGLRGKDIGR